MSPRPPGGRLGRLAEAILVPPFPGTTAPAWLLRALERGLAGVTLFGPNVAGREQLAGLTAALRSAAPTEPVIAIDEEGGDVTRLAHRTGSTYPGNAALGAVDDVRLTEAVYRALGADLVAVGINLDLAPSVDVNSAAGNPVIGTRSFGAVTSLVVRHAAAAVTGLQSAGVAACAKHFPGHGSTRDDTHYVLATVEGGLDVVRERDLPPFTAAISAGVAAVMPGHLRVPGLTAGLPATLSAPALGGLLRGELGFTGLIISDGLEMRGISGSLGIPEAAVLAVVAGVDLLCLGRDLGEDDFLAVTAAIAAAAAGGRLPVARLEDAAQRVARFRATLADGLPPGAGGKRKKGGGTGPAEGGTGPVDGGIGLVAARRAVRLTGQPAVLTSPVVIEITALRNIAVGSVPWGLAPWLPEGSLIRVPSGPGEQGAAVVRAALLRATGRSVIAVVRNAHRDPGAQDLITGLLAQRPDAVVVEMGLPLWRPPARTYLASYGASRTSGQAVAEVLGLADPLSGSPLAPDPPRPH